MTQKFQITHGFQENTSLFCRGCFVKGLIGAVNATPPIYLVITQLDSLGNKTYCLNCL